MRRFASAIGVAGVAALSIINAPAAAGPINDRATLDALLGANQIFEDFESFDIGFGGAVNLDVTVLDENAIANGQGPGLVESGATYIDPASVQLQWNGDGYFGLQTKTLLSNGGAGAIEIEYTTVVQAAGFDLRAFQGFGYSGTVEFYDTGNNLLGSVPVTLSSGGTENVFAGWEDAGGIGRVVVRSSNYAWSPLIDNHGYGATSGGGIFISVGGACPGTVTVDFRGATPNSTLGLLFALSPGNASVPNNQPCAGTQLGLSNNRLQLVTTFPSGPDGQGQRSGRAGVSACGGFLQIIEAGSCTTSNVDQIP